MPRPPVTPSIVVEIDAEDPRIAGNDPTMIPGHSQCNYDKFMAAQRKVTVYCPGDQRNPQFKTRTLSFNGGHSITVPFDRGHEVPLPYAFMIVQGKMGTTTDAEVMLALTGQEAAPQFGPIPGPWSGAYADEQPY